MNQKKILENIFIPPEEIFEKLYIYKNDGTYDEYTVHNDQTISVFTNAGVERRIPINLDHTISINQTPEGRVPTVHNLDNTYTIQNFDKSLVLQWLNVPHAYTLDVSTLSSDKVEFTYNYQDELPNVIVLQLDPSTLSYNIPNINPLQDTSANYTYIADPDNDTVFQEAIKHRMGPWLNMSISYNDPILAYITEGTDPTIQLSFTNFSLNGLGSEVGQLAIASQVPYLIFITPTNKYSRNPFGTISSMISLTHRQLVFDYGLFTSDTETGLSSPLEATYSYNNGELGINGRVDTQAIQYKFNPTAKALNNKTNYIKAEKAQRKALGTRRYYKLLERIKLAYNLENDEKVSQFDLFSRFTPIEYFSLYNSTPKTLDSIRAEIEEDTGTKVVEVSTKDPIKSKLLSLKTGQTAIDPNTTPELNITLFGGKYGK